MSGAALAFEDAELRLAGHGRKLRFVQAGQLRQGRQFRPQAAAEGGYGRGRALDLDTHAVGGIAYRAGKAALPREPPDKGPETHALHLTRGRECPAHGRLVVERSMLHAWSIPQNRKQRHAVRVD